MKNSWESSGRKGRQWKEDRPRGNRRNFGEEQGAFPFDKRNKRGERKFKRNAMDDRNDFKTRRHDSGFKSYDGKDFKRASRQGEIKPNKYKTFDHEDE